jgi:hypothetical protein
VRGVRRPRSGAAAVDSDGSLGDPAEAGCLRVTVREATEVLVVASESEGAGPARTRTEPRRVTIHGGKHWQVRVSSLTRSEPGGRRKIRTKSSRLAVGAFPQSQRPGPGGPRPPLPSHCRPAARPPAGGSSPQTPSPGVSESDSAFQVIIQPRGVTRAFKLRSTCTSVSSFSTGNT